MYEARSGQQPQKSTASSIERYLVFNDGVVSEVASMGRFLFTFPVDNKEKCADFSQTRPTSVLVTRPSPSLRNRSLLEFVHTRKKRWQPPKSPDALKVGHCLRWWLVYSVKFFHTLSRSEGRVLMLQYGIVLRRYIRKMLQMR
jgi:hypothetical protein